MKLYDHQLQGLELCKDQNHVAFFWDMGTGKTFVGAEKAVQLGAKVTLIVCQKSKIDDWIDHFEENYHDYWWFDLTNKSDYIAFTHGSSNGIIGIINYDLIWRRQELLQLKDFTLVLDESSLIQNETSERSKFILKLQPKNVILLSGTPTGGKYETLWSQLHLLGWNISKELFWKQYVELTWNEDIHGNKYSTISGYKNVDRLKYKMALYGCQFLKTEEVFDLPEQTFQTIKIQPSTLYRTFHKDCVAVMDDKTLVGDTTLTKMLYERQLCGLYSINKLDAFRDLLESTEERLIVFYNFTAELDQLRMIANDLNRPHGAVNGEQKNLKPYEQFSNSITFVQYQAGAMGLNLQKASRMIFFTLPLSSELFEQAKKRIHRIGQNHPCFYYQLICKGTIEEKILRTLEMRKDYTEELFRKGEENE